MAGTTPTNARCEGSFAAGTAHTHHLSLPTPHPISAPLLPLRQMVEGEPIDGYVVEATGQRVDALKRSTVGRLPHTLILQLKRFEFDFDAMAKLKLNSRCAVS